MKKIAVVLVLLASTAACNDNAGEMAACKRMCEPRLVRSFTAGYGDGCGASHPPNCVCEQQSDGGR